MERITYNTKCGNIIGSVVDETAFFHNVPFAKAERFEPAVQIEHFDSVIDSTGISIECPQYSAFMNDKDSFYTKEYRRNQEFSYCEDALYLSITAPANSQNCPVLVHIHGGGFLTGKHGEHPAADSFEYAKRGIILVSISYRMSIFSLYRSKNLHISDQLCALKWIKENISDYGGDVENITLIGESAGGISIYNLLFVEDLDKLVNRAVIMSGILLIPKILSGYTEEESKDFWDSVVNKLGINCEEELRKISAGKLWWAWHRENHRLNRIKLNQSGIDKVYVTGSPIKMLRNRKMVDIPLIVGSTEQDMFVPFLMFVFTKIFAKWWCKNKKENIYLYFFNRILPGNKYRAFHSCDLWYVFGNMEQGWRPFEDTDYKIKDAMIDSISSFAIQNDPGWDPYKRNDKKIRKFQSEKFEYLTGIKHYGTLLVNSIFRRGPM